MLFESVDGKRSDDDDIPPKRSTRQKNNSSNFGAVESKTYWEISRYKRYSCILIF